MDEPSKSHFAAVVELRHGLSPNRGEEHHVVMQRTGERPLERKVYAFDLPGKACAYRVFAWTERAPNGRTNIVTKIHGPDWRSNEAVLRNARLRDQD